MLLTQNFLEDVIEYYTLLQLCCFAFQQGFLPYQIYRNVILLHNVKSKCDGRYQ